MILTCPECATAYSVPDSKIPAGGRTVKCAACQARWTAYPQVEDAHAAQADDNPSPPAEAPGQEPAAPIEAPVFGALESAAPPPAEDLPRAFRARADFARKVRQAAAAGIVWAGMVAVVALVVVMAIIFRADVVRMWPSSAGAFSAIGLPVNSLGLAIEQIKARPLLKDGHAALQISGVIRNVETHAIVTPPLQIQLLDKSGKALATKIARAADPRIPPGKTRHFSLVMLDPPAAAHDLEIAFAPDAKGGEDAPPAPAAKSGDVTLRGAAPAPEPPAPEPVEAKPLPPGSPFALQDHGGAGEGHE